MNEGQPVRAFEGRQRGSHILHCGDGFFYNIREVRGSRVRLQCRHYGLRCPGTATFSLHSGLLRHVQPHTHMSDPLLEEDFALGKAMILEASTNVYGRKIQSILIDFKLRCQNQALASRFTTVRMRSALNAARAQNYPCIPNTLIGLGVLLGLPNMRLCTTIDGGDFIFQGVVGCIQNKTIALVFVSGRMLQFLNTLENVHADGTFKKRCRKPRMSQIFNLVTKFGENIVAVVRVLMLRRTEEAYTEVLSYLKTLAPNWCPRRIHCDFERAEINAFRAAFPRSRVVGCLWHYGVAFSRYANTLGLAQLARQNDTVFTAIRCLAATPLLPQHLIWTGVLTIWDFVQVSGFGNEFLPLFQYFEREWKPRIQELSVFGMPERTNNCSESDNRTLANVLPQNRPNVWHLIGGIVQLEYLAHCDKVAIDRGARVTEGRKYFTVVTDDRVRRLSALLVNQQITCIDFLRQVSSSVLAAVRYGLHMQWEPDSDADSD